MAEAMIITPVIEKSVDFVFSSTYQELQYFWKFKSNIQSLSNATDSRERKRKDINKLIVAAKKNADVIGSEVEKWVNDVEAMAEEAYIIIQGWGQAQMGCFFNFKCPNLKVRYSLSKKAAAKSIEIANLLREGESLQPPQVGYPAPNEQRPFTSPMDVFGFKSRIRVEEDVMKALLDEKIRVIAVCGMGGVGKTTMVKKVADQIKDKCFDEVVMVVVSKDHDLINVQQQLAEKLGLEIKEMTLDARADRLHTRLMDQQKRILLIIDDLWKELDLTVIGIPSDFERKGLKVILTSRFLRVCSKMDVREIIEVSVLTKEEAWVLFKKHANISDDSDVLEGYPRRVANKCQGLPLALEVIGKTLKDRKELSEWRDALQQLESAHDSDTSEDMPDKVYSSIAWSINYLASQHRSLLLLCSLFPEDHEIEVEYLVIYAKGLQLFKGIEKMTQTRDRVDKICNELKDCYLLIACDHRRVKLHDVVRDTCLRIASEGEDVYMVTHSGLTEWPDKDSYESYTAISLSFDNLDELPSRMKCSWLQLLRLSFFWRQANILNNLTSFLQVMEKLRVLNITNSVIKLSSQSLQTSMSLQTLNFHDCSLNGELSPLLESLVKVEVLSFLDSTYEGKWQKEIAELSNLKYLDLRFKSGTMNFLPTDILIHLKKLEELYLNYDLKDSVMESHAIMKEIGSLSNLNTIWITGFDSHCLAVLVENLDVEGLSRFYIDPRVISWPFYHFSRSMIVFDRNIDMLLEPKMKSLLSKH